MILFKMLGPVTVSREMSDFTDFETPMVRAVLTSLLRHRNQFVPIGDVASLVWQSPPASMSANLRTHVAKLRAALESRQRGLGGRLRTRRGVNGGGAYRLIVEPGELDADVFTAHVAQGRRALAAHDSGAAVAAFRMALGLWRGPVGDDLPDTPLLRQHAEALTEQRQQVYEDLLTARLAAGDAAGVLEELRIGARAAPLRERVRGLLMQALYRTGDAAGALVAYEHYRRMIAAELGATPTPQLQNLYLAILRHDRALTRDPGVPQVLLTA